MGRMASILLRPEIAVILKSATRLGGAIHRSIVNGAGRCRHGSVFIGSDGLYNGHKTVAHGADALQALAQIDILQRVLEAVDMYVTLLGGNPCVMAVEREADVR